MRSMSPIESTAVEQATASLQGKLAAIDLTKAVADFDVCGILLSANPRLLAIMGYRLDEVLGQHLRVFCTPAVVEWPKYCAFREGLARGEPRCDRFRRVAVGGRGVWLQDTYTPVADPSGRAYKIVTFATDVTADKRKALEGARFGW